MNDSTRYPVAGLDYPETWSQFLDWFPDDEHCLAFLERLRWADEYICPACKVVATEPWRQTRGRLTCPSCRHQTTATAGTIFHRTRTPLTTWFAAVWYVTNQKHGASALGLQRVLGLGSYQTAWTMLHKLRRAMVRPGRDRLSGLVEVDETYIGSDTGTDGRQVEKKAIAAVAVEVKHPKGFGRVRLRRIHDVSANSLVPFVCDVVETGSVVHTDGWHAYSDLPNHGYTHEKTVLSASGDPAHVSMPAVHRVSSLLKRWLLGTHHGAVRPRHLDYYLDEYVFRFNRRTSRSRGMLFYRLLEQSIITEPSTYRAIVGAPPGH